MFDTHVNLHGEAFADDLPDTLARARAAGVSRFIAICDRLDNAPAVRAIAEANPDIWCTAGIHPHHAKDFADITAETLTKHASHEAVVAIGECGLDFHYGYSAEDEQQSVFSAHIEAAQRTGLPLVIHSREADELMGDMLEAAHKRAPFGLLMHCYTGSEKLARRALDLGAYFSVSGILSFKNAHDVRAVISQIPLERILLETDCPYLAPVPHRGRRNEPAYLIHVAEALAALFERPVDEITQITEQNAIRYFQLEAAA